MQTEVPSHTIETKMRKDYATCNLKITRENRMWFLIRRW